MGDIIRNALFNSISIVWSYCCCQWDCKTCYAAWVSSFGAGVTCVSWTTLPSSALRCCRYRSLSARSVAKTWSSCCVPFFSNRGNLGRYQINITTRLYMEKSSTYQNQTPMNPTPQIVLSAATGITQLGLPILWTEGKKDVGFWRLSWLFITGFALL